MAAQDRVRGDQAVATQCAGQLRNEGGEHGPVCPVQAWSWVGAAQDGDFVLGKALRQKEVSLLVELRELVVFTPPHRQAFCIEPYTCITDAINLQQRGTDAGLQVLPPGGQWTGIVEMRV